MAKRPVSASSLEGRIEAQDARGEKNDIEQNQRQDLRAKIHE